MELKGVSLLKSKGAKLILPNHQSYIDPQLLAAITTQFCDFMPVVSERFMRIPIVGYFLRLWHAIPVSDLKHGNRDPHVLKNVYAQVMNAFTKGKSVIIYPSGHVTDTPYERIQNKQSAYLIVRNLPENVQIIGVRISGLWGSMWSMGWNGSKPNFILTFLKGAFYYLANLIFFIPKRDVRIEFIDINTESREQAKGDRYAFNNYLEEFYNIKIAHELIYCKHIFFLPQKKRIYPENLLLN